MPSRNALTLGPFCLLALLASGIVLSASRGDVAASPTSSIRAASTASNRARVETITGSGGDPARIAASPTPDPFPGAVQGNEGADSPSTDPAQPSPPAKPDATSLARSSLTEGTIVEGKIPKGDPSQVEVLGAHDLLEISVFDLEPFNRTVRIADDGSITLPFLGRIAVQGLTRVELEQRIAALLGDKYVNDPQVSVFVKEYESRKVSVSGAVRTPATFEMMGGKTLLDVVSEAGGFTEDVGRSVYVIRRHHDGTTERIQVDLESLIYAGETELNVPIQPGDVIYAPIEEKITIYVNGAVKTPGGYEFKHGDQITVLRAITKAGGTTERAAERRVQILRRHSDGNQSIIPVDLRKVRAGKIPDPVLLREDVIDVPEAFF